MVENVTYVFAIHSAVDIACGNGNFTAYGKRCGLRNIIAVQIVDCGNEKGK